MADKTESTGTTDSTGTTINTAAINTGATDTGTADFPRLVPEAAAPHTRSAEFSLPVTPVELTRALVDIESPSHHEQAIADAIEELLSRFAEVGDYEVLRTGNTVLARTRGAKSQRVVLAGHSDTVPIADNVPATDVVNNEGEAALFGCGTVDMKSGLAVYLLTFINLCVRGTNRTELTFVAYEGEEVASEFNGLGHVAAQHPEWLECDFALLGEPTNAEIEAGCQGSIRVKVTATGKRAHSARAWMGSNAIHSLAEVITRVAAYQPQEVDIDGLRYREGLNVVRMGAGVANNTIPDEAWCFINYRFAPNKSVAAALEHLYAVLSVGEDARFVVEVDDAVGGALPGLNNPVAAELIAATGGKVSAKFGWTDVARFGDLGIPAVNFGPGNPSLAHAREENCPLWMIEQVATQLERYLEQPS